MDTQTVFRTSLRGLEKLHEGKVRDIYAIDAATAADAQVASALGISAAGAWPKIAVTPMIGQNDESDEVFTLGDAQQLRAELSTRLGLVPAS